MLLPDYFFQVISMQSFHVDPLYLLLMFKLRPSLLDLLFIRACNGGFERRQDVGKQRI